MTFFVEPSRANLLTPISIIFIFFTVAHLLGLQQSDSSLEKTYLLAIFYVLSSFFCYSRLLTLKVLGSLLAQILGTLVISLISLKTLFLYSGETKLFWLVTPPFFWLALTVIISGWRGVKQFWRFLLGITSFSWFIPYLASYSYRSSPNFLTYLSTQLSAYGLWYLGLPVKPQGHYIFIDSRVVEVGIACTAMPIFILFLSLLLTLSLYFPSLIQNLPLTTAIALGIGFSLSIVRIMIMTVIVNDQPVFDYWHGTTGANIFSGVGLFLLSVYLLWQMPSNFAISGVKNVVSIPKNTKIQSSQLTSVILWALVGLLGTSLLIRQGGVKQFGNFSFPEAISLPGWTLTRQEMVSPLAEMQITAQKLQQSADIFMSGHRYLYESPNHSGSLTATFRYIVNVTNESDLATHYQRQDPNSEAFKILTERNKNIPDLGNNILSFTDQNSLYYSACLTPNLKTQIQSYKQLTKDYDTNQLLAFKFQNLIPLLMGQRLSQDNRCLWMELKLSPIDSKSPTNLQVLWKFFQNYWGQHYPKP